VPLIVFEGIDGCGKTTQVAALTQRLATAGIPFRHLREPGGTALGERQRALLLDPATQACPTAELFGYLQARAQLCAEVIAPALAAGGLVLLDRFYHSTLAYQAYGLGLDRDAVRAAIRLATGGIVPDLVLWLALDPAEAARRRAAARGQDRIEARGLDYLTRVHDGYRALVASDGLVELDARARAEDLAERIWALVRPFTAGSR
jgi:dTMP kinase